MKSNMFWLLLFTIIAIFTALNTPILAQIPQPQIEVLFSIKPIPFRSGNQTQIVYEIHLTNFGRNNLLLNHLEIKDENNLAIRNFENAELNSILKKIGTNDDSSSENLLESGKRFIIFIWLEPRGNTHIPKHLKHKFIFESKKNDGSKTEYVSDDLILEINKAKPPIISSPLKGKNWVVANGASNSSNHRRTIIIQEVKPQISQRFAIDFAKLGDDGKLAKDNFKDNKNYYGYGEEIIAVSNAKVVSVQDDIPENIPLEKPVVPITYKNLPGNSVILDIGNVFFAFYAHLQPKSIKVKVGDKIKKGQTIGLIGNSGNSDLPHLHFHISNKNSPLSSEGVPFLFDGFYNLGFVDSPDKLAEGVGWNPVNKQNPKQFENQHPQNNSVIGFQ